MLDNYELKIFKLQQDLLNAIYHYKAENLKFSKTQKKAQIPSMQENFN